jgi:hypothetical protein
MDKVVVVASSLFRFADGLFSGDAEQEQGQGQELELELAALALALALG